MARNFFAAGTTMVVVALQKRAVEDLQKVTEIHRHFLQTANVDNYEVSSSPEIS